MDKEKYSVVICYRNRREHLNITIPRIKEVLKNISHEIIVVEQDDDARFRRSNTFNEGAKIAEGNVVIFSDVDYYPENVQYYDGHSDVFLPVKKVKFVYNNLKEKPIEEIPSGYRHFQNSVDDNFFGGVITFTSAAFYRINGFNPLFIGWGFEDADLRERVNYYGMIKNRSEDNLFLALDHPDSGVPQNDLYLQNNIRVFTMWQQYLAMGIKNQIATVKYIKSDHELVDKWIKVTDFGIKDYYEI